MGAGALALFIGYSFAGWLPSQLHSVLETYNVLLGFQALCYLLGAVLLLVGCYKLWRLASPADTPPIVYSPTALKGPSAFAPEDGPLFRRLGRDDELRELLGWIQDDQVNLVVIMGASGAGKTSLLRAGVAALFDGKAIGIHYVEAKPSLTEQDLVRAITFNWPDARRSESERIAPIVTLDELFTYIASPSCSPHVIIIDQLEQLRNTESTSPVWLALRSVIRDQSPPYKVTWIVAFRRDFRADWSDFIIPDQEHGTYPKEQSLSLFSVPEAKQVVEQLIGQSQIQVDNAVVEDLLKAAATPDGISPVDIGIGLLVLGELFGRSGGRPISIDDYKFVGGADGVLTEYLRGRLERFAEEDRALLLRVMLELRDPALTFQRLAEGASAATLSDRLNAPLEHINRLLHRVVHSDMRLLEEIENSEPPRFRLPHERYIPAIHRLTGRLLVAAEEAQIHLDEGYLSWKRTGSRKYLLSGAQLASVTRFKGKLQWSPDSEGRKTYYNRSTRYDRLRLAGIASLVIGCFALLALVWYLNRQSTTNHFLVTLASMPANEVKPFVSQYMLIGGLRPTLDTNRIRSQFLQESLSPTSRKARNLAVALVDLAVHDSEVSSKAVTTLESHCKSAELVELTAISNSLNSLPSGREAIVAILNDSDESEEHRLRAAMGLININHKDQSLEPYMVDLVHSAARYATRSPRELDSLIRLLQPKSDRFVPVLVSELEESHGVASGVELSRLLVEIADLQTSLPHVLRIAGPSEFRERLDRLISMHGKVEVMDCLAAVPEDRENVGLGRTAAKAIMLANEPMSAATSEFIGQLRESLKRPALMLASEGRTTFVEVGGGDPTGREAMIKRLSQVCDQSELGFWWLALKGSESGTGLLTALQLRFPGSIDRSAFELQQSQIEDPELFAVTEWIVNGSARANAYSKVISDPAIKAEVAERLRKQGMAGYSVGLDEKAGIREAMQTLSARRAPFAPLSKEVAGRLRVASPQMVMVKIDSGFGLCGNSEREPHRCQDDELRCFSVNSFEISNTETTIAHFSDFLEKKGRGEYRSGKSREFDLHLMCPASMITWFQAAEFCNWLSAQDGLPDSEWWYAPNEKAEYDFGMKVVLGGKRRGYRLPTSFEWERACRASSKTRWSSGQQPEQLENYAIFFNNAREVSWPVGSRCPNGFGLFDMHGNVAEWCHEPVGTPYELLNSESENTVELQLADKSAMREGQTFYARGGNFWFRTGLIRSSASRVFTPDEVFQTVIGFRVAKPVLN